MDFETYWEREKDLMPIAHEDSPENIKDYLQATWDEARRTDPRKKQMRKALTLAWKKARFPHLWGYDVEQAIKADEEE